MNNDNEMNIDPVLYTDPEDSVPVQTFAIPDRALNVEAASLSLLEPNNEQALTQFNQFASLPREAKTEWLREQQATKMNAYEQYLRADLPKILGDASIPAAQRIEIYNTAQNSKLAPEDTAAVLASAGHAAPIKNETPLGNKSRQSAAMAAYNAAAWLDERQQVINNALGQRDGTMKKVVDFLEGFVPGYDAITAGKIASKTGENVAKSILLPGSTYAELRDKYYALPHEQKLEALKNLADIVSQSSGLLTSQNQLSAEAILNDIAVGGGISDAGKMFTNVVNLLDLAGIGFSVKGVVSAGKKGAKYVSRSFSEGMSNEAAKWDMRSRDVNMDNVNVTGDSKVSIPTQAKGAKQVPIEEARIQQLKDVASQQLSRDDFEELRSSIELVKNNKPKLGSRATPEEVSAYAQNKAAYDEQLATMNSQMKAHQAAVKAADELPDAEKALASAKADVELVPMSKNPIAESIQQAMDQSLMFTHHPRAPGNILSQANFDIGRSLHMQNIMDTGGGMAEAVYGVGRNEALVKNVAPQIGATSGRVKVVMDAPEKSYKEFVASGMGGIIDNIRDGMKFTPAELQQARSSVVKDYTEATEIKINDAMSSVRWDGEKLTFSGVYTNGHGGWASAQEAIDQTKYALRKRGVSDEDITVLKVDGDEMVPVDKNKVKDVEGLYAVRLDVNDFVMADNVKNWDELDVKRNFLDRFATSGQAKQGSLQRHVFDPNSSLHKTLTGSMSVADDKSVLVTEFLLKKFEDFTNPYVKLDKQMKAKVDAYIKDANVHEVRFDPQALANQFPAHVVDMLRTWRDAWDGMYHLENADIIRALRKERYEWFDHPNINAAVRKTQKNYSNNKVYDPATDTVRKLTNQEISDIYTQGGWVGEFRRPMNLNGQEMAHMIVRNTPTEYSRGLRDTDRVLEYRHGYYSVSYKAPRFIDEIAQDGTRKTIGVAGTTKEANEAVSRLQMANPNSKYVQRGDDKNIERTLDTYWDLNQSFGRLAQRHRGKLLETTVGLKPYGATDFIESPADSAVRASMSMGGRIAMRDVVDTAKTRFMHQFDDLIAEGFPKSFPASRDDIRVKGEAYTSRLADARTTWEYIRSMENGYINVMDETLKAGFNVLADAFGNKGWETVEKLSRSASEANFSGTIKGGVFASYLATNPFRQWIVQMNQSLRLLGYSGIHVPKVYNYIVELVEKPGSEIAKFYNETGVYQSISRGNLIRGTLMEAAGSTTKVGRGFEKGIGTLRKYGYDIGEAMNNITSAAAVWEKYVREGADVMDKTVRANMQAEFRAINRNMNRAGEMPYNQNALSLVFTYMQVPHKFATQWADRSLSRAERARLIAADLTLWGAPVGALAAVSDNILPDNPNLRELLTDGLESFIINHGLTTAFGTKTNIDFSSLAPYDLTGFGDMFKHMMFDKGISALVTQSPAGRVLGLSTDSRLGFALHQTAQFFKDINEDEFKKVRLADVADAWGRMSSGWTNFQEARIMYQLQKVVDKFGRVTDDAITTPEVIAKVFGFGTGDSKDYYEILNRANKAVKNYQDEAKKDAQLIMQSIRHVSDGDVQGVKAIGLITQALSDQSNFPSKQAQMEYLGRMQEEVLSSAYQKEMERLQKLLNFPDPEQNHMDLVRISALPEEDKQTLSDAYSSVMKTWKEIEQANKERK